MKTGIAAVTLGLFAVTSASAVQPAAAQNRSPPSVNGTAVTETQSDSSLKGGRSESLSSKLNRTDGVITPKSDVDPGIHVPAPDPHPNSTPVIPPSATGGNTAK